MTSGVTVSYFPGENVARHKSELKLMRVNLKGKCYKGGEQGHKVA